MAYLNATRAIELVAIEDGWVNDNPEKRDTNYNGKGLGIGRWVHLNRGLLKFDLDDVGVEEEALLSAELKLYGKALHPCIVKAEYTANSFDEATVTWNNQPPPTILHPPDTSLMGSTTDIPSEEGWFTVPIDLLFVKHRWGRNFYVILKGYEMAEDSYCSAKDKEEEAGLYAPKLILHVSAPPTPPTPPSWWPIAAIGGGMCLIVVLSAVIIPEIQKMWK
ncbi:hypothetical protein ES702_03857 [subsurface metagenome]